MTSKEQERKALEKIRKIIAELGADSYIGIAFDGCIEDAEENIENDWACSMKERVETLERNLQGERERIANLLEIIDSKEVEIKALKEEASILNQRREEMAQEWRRAKEAELEARREITITQNGETTTAPLYQMKYINHNGMTFVNIVEESGWTTSIRMSEIEGFEIA